jgi:perosamine synthetase
LNWLVEERRKIAAKYNSAFSGLKKVIVPFEPSDCKSNWQSYMLFIKKDAGVDRNEVMQELLNRGISSRRGIMTSHRETAYKTENQNLSLPVSESICDNSVILPLYVPMSDEDIETVIKEVVALLN